jgi:hypothetical protein
MNNGPPSWNPLRWPPDRWIALSSFLTALCALFFTIYQSYVIREHERISTEPQLHVSYFYTKDFAGFIFSNIGLGPGQLHYFTVSVDRKPQPDWHSVLMAIGFDNPLPSFEFVLPAAQAWFGADTSIEIFKFSPGPHYDKLSKEYTRIALGGCYCSVYAKCWLFESRKRYPVDSCEEKPKIVFKSPPYRAAPQKKSTKWD